MKYKNLEKYYLCGIANNSNIYEFQVGVYNKERESFSFSNGSYTSTELYKTPNGRSSTYIKTAISLQEIDDKELLYKFQDNV